ncbi:MAG: PAS domain S-box protein [Candidatus Thorarchaeota archaeon]
MKDIENPQENDSMYKSFIEQSEQGVMLLQGNPAKIIYANPAMTKLSGYSREELQAFTLEDMIRLTHPDDVDLAFGNLESDLRGEGESSHFVYRAIRKDGSIRWAEVNSTLIQHQGQPALLVSYLDISKRTAIEKALEESEVKYRTLVENMQDGIAILQDDVIVFANTALGNILGFSKEELEGLNFANMIAPESRTIVAERYKKRIAGVHVPNEYDIFALHKDGSKRLLRLKAATIEYEGKPAVVSTISDVTEKKKMELAHKESEEKYRTLVENMQDGVAIAQDGNLEFVNNKLSEILGYSTNELLGKPFLTLIAPQDKAYVAERYQKVVAGEGIDQTIDVQVISKGGTFPYVRLNGTFIEYQGRPAVLVTIIDITERKRIELALEESELKYRTLIESMMDGIAIHQDGKIIFTNNASSRILGYSVDELEGIEFIKLIAPDDRDMISQFYHKRLLGDKIPDEYEVRGLHKDGTQPILSIRVAMIEYGGRPAVAAIIRDVTLQREAENTLRLVQYSIDHTSDPVFWIDKDGNFVYTNEAARTYLGYTTNEISNITVWDVYPEFSTERGPEMLARVKEKGSAVYEVMIKDKHEKLMPVEVTASYLVFEGRELFFTYVKDIRERKETEMALKKSAEELRATKDRALLYLDIMGHDIRNKLQGMMLASQLALIGNDSDEVAEAMAIQEKTIETIQSLITRVKSLEEMINEPLIQREIAPVLDTVIAQLKEQHPSVKIEMDIPSIKMMISSDSFLETLIMNILDNAVEHNPNDSPSIWIKISNDDLGVTLSIADNGQGISHSRKLELLDPNRRYGGIALHQSKFIAEKYGGHIEISDRIPEKQDEGAMFRIWIPRFSPQ